jgi:CBS domain-containing protein
VSESNSSRSRVIVGVDGSAGSLAARRGLPAVRRSRREPVMPMSSGARPVTTQSDSTKDIGAVPVNAVMSRDVLVVGTQDPVIEVWQRMQDLNAPLAVVREDTRIVAVVSQRTLAIWWPSGGPREMRRRRVRDVIDPGTPTVHPHTTAREVAELISDLKLEGVPVVAAGGALLGLVTPTELVRLLADRTPSDPVAVPEG